jgi:hypothetical protein
MENSFDKKISFIYYNLKNNKFKTLKIIKNLLPKKINLLLLKNKYNLEIYIYEGIEFWPMYTINKIYKNLKNI